MLRLLLFIFAALGSSVLWAADTSMAPSLFTPVEGDKSLVYLGAIFGNQLVAGGTDMHLLSRVFEVFNSVCLTVGIIICIYTIIVGTLHTAAQGKPLGEKWNGVWIPIRMVMGVSLLVPKAGTGYCMAQYCVMWLVIQGIGAADTIWSKALDYFIEGGAIYSNSMEKAGSYMNQGNLDNTYSLEQFILINTACVAAHNDSDNAQLYGKYKIYSTDDDLQINFGNPKLWGEVSTGVDAGFECGAIIMPAIDTTNPNYDLMLATYSHAFEALSLGLEEIGEFLADESGADAELWGSYFPVVQAHAVTFINQLAGANNILFPEDSVEGGKEDSRSRLEDL
ncbi:MAG TPA: DotA/TraY family protein, partial [Gammaproteobacteria bacterium]|nr:DotA/TraY family protein [Gammaproteobacteria bacterium]